MSETRTKVDAVKPKLGIEGYPGMTEYGDESLLGYKIQILTEEAAYIRERYSSSPKGLYRDQLEVRYLELGNEIQTLKKKSTVPLISEPNTSSVESAPFGIAFGIPVNELDVEEEIDCSPGKYTLNSVPKPHSAFESYVVLASESNGVGWVKAIGHDITTGSDGIRLLVKFDEVATRLEKVYGTCSDFKDELEEGSYWNKPLDWMMGLLERERRLSRTWDRESGATLPKGLTSVHLYAAALGTDRGFIGVEYEGTNYHDCRKEIEDSEDNAL